MKFTVVDRSGGVHPLEAASGQKLMEVIREAGLPIAALCGGCRSCATCHVHVDLDYLERLPPMDEEEMALLELADDVRPQSRLSCQILASQEIDGITITLAAGSEL